MFNPYKKHILNYIRRLLTL